MDWLVTLGAGLLGLVVGSFLNVVVHRVPRNESVVSPPSSCPRCGSSIRPYDNVPVLSWLILRGRCRACSEPISPRYPLVEVGTAIAFAGAGAYVGLDWALPAYLYAVAVGVALTMIDLDVHRLPDVIVLPSYVVVAALLVIASWGNHDWGALVRAGLGCVILFGAYFLMMLVYPAGMGPGDVKLAGVLGLLLGWWGWAALAVGGFAAFFLGGIFAVGLMLARRAGRKSGIPFGPWMILGAAVGIAAGEQLGRWYLDLLT